MRIRPLRPRILIKGGEGCRKAESHEAIIRISPPRSSRSSDVLHKLNKRMGEEFDFDLSLPHGVRMVCHQLPLTRSIAPHYSPRLRASRRSFVRSLAHFAHSLARGTLNDWMAILSVFFLFSTIVPPFSVSFTPLSFLLVFLLWPLFFPFLFYFSTPQLYHYCSIKSLFLV